MKSKNILLDTAVEIVRNVLSLVSSNTSLPDMLISSLKADEIITPYEDQINALANELNVNAIDVVFHEPQVYDILESYLAIVYTQNMTTVISDKAIPEEDIINFVVKVAESKPSLNNESSIVALREYISVIANLFQAKSLVSDDIPSRWIFKLVEDRFYASLHEKIEYILKTDYIPSKPEYEKTKKSLNLALKDLEKVGHIYPLDEFTFNRFYVPPMLSKNRDGVRVGRFLLNAGQDDISWQHIFDNDYITYVIGGAGYGKSLFLKNLVNNTNKLCLSNADDYLIILCDLKAYYIGDKGDAKPVVDFFLESMVSSLGIDSITKEFLHHYLKIGRCLILLDAIDEIPKSKRNTLHKKVVNIIKNNYPFNRVCMTSRGRNFIPQNDIEVFKIQPLSENDIVKYIDNMISLKAFKKENKADFMKQANALIEKNFLNSFLVLSLLVSIYKAENRLPENKVDLYKKCFNYIARERELDEKKTAVHLKDVDIIMKDSTFISLSELAAPNNQDIPKSEIEKKLLKLYRYKFPSVAETEKAISNFLEFCSTRTEFFVPSSTEDNFRFFHRSFFEYFYTRFILRKSNVKDIYQLMTQFDVDSEVFELVAAILKEEDEEKYQKLISYIISETKKEFQTVSDGNVAFDILTLVMQVVNDSAFIDDYYNLIITYHNEITRYGFMVSNHRLIVSWLKKVFVDDGKKDYFLSLYENDCVRHIILSFENYEKNIRVRAIQNSNYPKEFFYNHMEYVLRFAPFYVQIFDNYRDLNSEMKNYVSMGIKALWARIKPESYEKSLRSTFRKGFTNYLLYLDDISKIESE